MQHYRCKRTNPQALGSMTQMPPALGMSEPLLLDLVDTPDHMQTASALKGRCRLPASLSGVISRPSITGQAQRGCLGVPLHPGHGWQLAARPSRYQSA